MSSSWNEWLETLRQLGDRMAAWPSLVPSALTIMAATALALALLTFVLALLALRRARSLEHHYHTLMRGASGQALDQVLSDVLARLDVVEGHTTKVGDHARTIDVGLESAVQRVNLVRYEASPQGGAASSFSLALLDAHDNGVVLTALAQRDRTRVYAKPLRRGRSPHALSTDEQRAVDGHGAEPQDG